MEGVIAISNSRLSVTSSWKSLRFCLPFFIICTSALYSTERRFDVIGYGWAGNRALTRLITTLAVEEGEVSAYDTDFLDNALFLVASRLNKDGYLNPELALRLLDHEGETLEMTWETREPLPLPPDFKAISFSLKIKRGLLYYYKRIDFDGLKSIKTREARSFFYPAPYLIDRKSYRRFSPRQLKKSVQNLTEALHQKGYQEAEVTVTHETRDLETGAVAVSIAVYEGPPYRVRSLVERLEPSEQLSREQAEALLQSPIFPDLIYSSIWQRKSARDIRNRFYKNGFPDASVTFRITQQEKSGETILLDLIALVKPGPRVRLGEVKLTGLEHTHESVVAQRVKAQKGDWLNRIEVEETRFRLGKLHIFDSIETEYSNDQELPFTIRSLDFVFSESNRLEISVLAGYGSYERLRGGIQIEQKNLLGRAHQNRMKFIQSTKSSSGELRYKVPELLWETVDGTIQLDGLLREEVSFRREEWGFGLGLERYFPSLASRLGISYRLENLKSQDLDTSTFISRAEARAGSLLFTFLHDRRDHPITPYDGLRLKAGLEISHRALGADVNFQRLTLNGSWHRKIAETQWLHLGLTHGVVLGNDSQSDAIPFNKRFFPGGENSIRGYDEGAASPRDSNGEFIGAETISLINLELENALGPGLSLMLFGDLLLHANEGEDFFGDDILTTIGTGLRYKTIVGPLRLEYGYNMNPRSGDPKGKLHFSIGFPF